MNSPAGSILSGNVVGNLIAECGVDIAGIAKADKVRPSEDFEAWLKKGYAGEMNYLLRNLDKRLDPVRLFAGAKSIIVIGLNYSPPKGEIIKQEAPYRIARYAWGEDYHTVFRRKLESLRTKLTALNPNLRGRICVDTAPLMDKYWAQKAGLGWQGKHTNLVSRQFGSWLLIGSLMIDMEVDVYDKPHSNHCGKCTACLDACPTGALVAPYRIDATRCISYWTIESKAKKIPDNIKRNLNKYVFGCDICLEVCPFNKFQRPRRAEEFSRREEIGLVESGRVTNLSEEQFNEHFADSPIYRPGFSGIKRNIEAALFDHTNK